MNGKCALFSVVFFISLVASPVFAQTDSLTVKDERVVQQGRNSLATSTFLGKLPYFLDDLMVVVGYSRSGIYMSRFYPDTKRIGGLVLGVENYFPVLPKAFLHYGVHTTSRGLLHTPYDVKLRTQYVDVPLFLSYELPELRQYNLSIQLGMQYSGQLSARLRNDYPETSSFNYELAQLRKHHLGYVFGLSLEHKSWYGRVRMLPNLSKLVANDQGMNTSLQIEFGFFPFRNLRRVPAY